MSVTGKQSSSKYYGVDDLPVPKDEPDDVKDMPMCERYFLPSVEGYKAELANNRRAKTVILGPANMEDLARPDLYDQIQKCQDFKLHFSRQRCPNGQFQGYLELCFEEEKNANNCAHSLKQLRPGLDVLHTKYSNGVAADDKDIRGAADASLKDPVAYWASIAVVMALPKSVLLADLSQKFPDAHHIWFPQKIDNDRKWHAYVEFPGFQHVNDLHDTMINIKGRNFKVLRLQNVPLAHEVIRRVEDERSKPETGSTEEMRVRLEQLLVYSRHYLLSDDCGVSGTDKETMKELNTAIRNKLNSDHDKRDGKQNKRSNRWVDDDVKPSKRSFGGPPQNGHQGPGNFGGYGNRAGPMNMAGQGQMGGPGPMCGPGPGGIDSMQAAMLLMGIMGSGMNMGPGGPMNNMGRPGHLSQDCPNFYPDGGRGSGSGNTCYGCGQSGHIHRDCPHTDRETTVCHSCGGSGHKKSECPEGPVDATAGYACYGCGKTGHIHANCPSTDKETMVCHGCGSTGHKKMNCPETPGGGENVRCFQCNQYGHMSRECPDKSVQRTCYKCGNTGHISVMCPNQY